MSPVDWETLARAHVHPLRVACVEFIAATQGPVSPVMAARALGRPVNEIAYHFQELARRGVIVLAETDTSHGGREHRYRLA